MIANLLPVATVWVINCMYMVQPSAPRDIVMDYAEIGSAISEASAADPVFDGPEGGYRTAALLIALAHHESHFRKTAVGDKNRSFGLFQIQPPTAHIESSMLMMPRKAAFVAIDLLRTSMKMCRKRPLPDRLAWYAQGNGTCWNDEPSDQALKASREIFVEATWIMMKSPPPKPTG